MQFKAIEICVLLNGELEGNPDEVVYSLAKIEEGKVRFIALTYRLIAQIFRLIVIANM